MQLHLRRRLARGGRLAVSIGPAALLAIVALVSTACGSGHGGLRPVPPGIDLPVVGTLGRVPTGPSVIHLDVDADGRIACEGEGPLSLVALREALQRATADPAWRESGYSSSKILLVHADRDLPWVLPLWIMQVACEPKIQLYKMFLGARSASDGHRGALGWTLPKDGSIRPLWQGSPPIVIRAILGLGDGVRGDPASLVGPIVEALRRQPHGWVVLDVAAPRPSGPGVPTGFVAEVLDQALAAGVPSVSFQGTAVPEAAPVDADGPPAVRPDHVEDLLQCVAWWKARSGLPTLELPGLPDEIRNLAAPRPRARGVLASLYGSEVDPTESSPVPKRGSHGEEELEEETVIRDAEIAELPMPRDFLQSEEYTWRPYLPNLPENAPTPNAVDRALTWLAAHQRPDGSWAAATSDRWCNGKEIPGHGEPDRPGSEIHDVGVTGLALCAFLGAGYTHWGRHGFAKTVSKGLRYLRSVQDEGGCFGSRDHLAYLQDHAAAALATIEAYRMTGSSLCRGAAQKAIDHGVATRGVGWATDADAATTTWMALGLWSAGQSNENDRTRDRPPRLTFDPESLLSEVLGAFPRGAASGEGLLEPARAEGGALGGVMLRVLLDPDAEQREGIRRYGVAALAGEPNGSPSDAALDPVASLFATIAAYQVGGETWRAWSAVLSDTVVATQGTEGDVCGVLGSWDPAGPSGREGGRVATTALRAMCLETYYRYAHALGNR